MTVETENLILEHLKRIRAKLNDMSLDMGELKIRHSAMESSMGQLMPLFGTMNGRIDRLDGRMARIERRFDLIEA